MKKPKLRIDVGAWMGDLRIAYLEPLAQLLLIRVMMIAECAAGWVRVEEDVCGFADIARLSGLPIDAVEAHMPVLLRLALVAQDASTGAYFIPDRVKQEEVSAKRSAAGKKGGGNPKLREDARQQFLFKQKSNNVISFEKAKACDGGAAGVQKKKKEPKKKKNNKYIYTPEFDLGDKPATPDNPWWFEHGCIRLRKKDYQRWASDFPCFTDDELHAALVQRAEWLDTRPEVEQSRWFISTRHDLRRRHAIKQTQLFGKGGAA